MKIGPRTRALAAAPLAVALYVGAYLAVNHSPLARAGDIERRGGAELARAGETLDIVTWNLGYGGLGAASDFAMDGGAHYFPPSRRATRANVAAIGAFLDEESADVVLLQEIARAGPLNYWVDLKARADLAFANLDGAYLADFRTRLLPWPLRLDHGKAIYARRALAGVDAVALPAEDGAILGVRRRYAALIARLDAGEGAGWTIANVHLAAFDEDAAVRTRQLRELLAWAQGEYEAGRHVVLGGDWNLELAETGFPSTTEEKFLFWVFPFPDDALAEGWRVAADPAAPTVRTNERPYRPGENYTTVIDGFIVSPNVGVQSVAGVDLGFAHSDHQPVRLRARALPQRGAERSAAPG